MASTKISLLLLNAIFLVVSGSIARRAAADGRICSTRDDCYGACTDPTCDCICYLFTFTCQCEPDSNSDTVSQQVHHGLNDTVDGSIAKNTADEEGRICSTEDDCYGACSDPTCRCLCYLFTFTCMCEPDFKSDGVSKQILHGYGVVQRP